MSVAQTQTIEIAVNGESMTVPEGLSVEGLLIRLGIDPERVAIELDREIIRQPSWSARILNHGSRLEIVQFVGGG